VVAVIGLRPGSGATTIARALAVELALRDAGRAALATAGMLGSPGIPLGTPSAVRLARAASRAGAGCSRAVGRLAMVESRATDVAHGRLVGLAPLVIDAAESGAGDLASLVDVTVLVGSPDCQPALAAVVREPLAGVSPCVTVLNRHVEDDAAWDGRYDVSVPESRLAAHLALVGREAPSAFGRAVAELADRLRG
jgi:hypothetical protein